MSSYSYESPTSPKFGFFPTGPASPNAFAGFHSSSSPMCAALGKALMPSSAQNVPQNNNSGPGYSSFSLKRLGSKK